eukprot:scaffold426_cov319-Pavlova_lutheri.AAC.24
MQRVARSRRGLGGVAVCSNRGSRRSCNATYIHVGVRGARHARRIARVRFASRHRRPKWRLRCPPRDSPFHPIQSKGNVVPIERGTNFPLGGSLEGEKRIQNEQMTASQDRAGGVGQSVIKQWTHR